MKRIIILFFLILSFEAFSQNNCRHNQFYPNFIREIDSIGNNPLIYDFGEVEYSRFIIFENKTKKRLIDWHTMTGPIKVFKYPKNKYSVIGYTHCFYNGEDNILLPVVKWDIEYKKCSYRFIMDDKFMIPVNWNRNDTKNILSKYKILANNTEAISEDWDLALKYTDEILDVQYGLFFAAINDKCEDCRNKLLEFQKTFDVVNFGEWGMESKCLIEILKMRYGGSISN
jgi:hypothetical protein